MELSEFWARGQAARFREYCCLSISKSVILKCDSSSRALGYIFWRFFLLSPKVSKSKARIKGAGSFRFHYHFSNHRQIQRARLFFYVIFVFSIYIGYGGF